MSITVYRHFAAVYRFLALLDSWLNWLKFICGLNKLPIFAVRFKKYKN